MNYYELSSNAKFICQIRIFYLSLLILSTIYCIALISLNTYTLLPIPMLIANGLSLFNSLCHLYEIFYEHRNTPVNEGGLICIFDLLPNIIIIFTIVFYIVEIALGQIVNIQQEFALMIIYAVSIGSIIIFPCLCTLIWCIGYCGYTIYKSINKEPSYLVV